MKTVLIYIVAINFLQACMYGKSGKEFEISSKPVFSEIDTTGYSMTNLNFSKHDYFLITGKLKNKEKLHSVIDSFVKNTSDNCIKYSNYTIFFYNETPFLNQEVINKANPKDRYQIFQHYERETFIASYYCSKYTPITEIRFQPK